MVCLSPGLGSGCNPSVLEGNQSDSASQWEEGSVCVFSCPLLYLLFSPK